ncbi:MAG: hypothetical protein GXP27_05205 [Planctomycetes bacterium]|nr:hypothetical protein [Planctomycetota bacterium]
MTQKTIGVNRTLVGVIALGCLVAAGVLLIFSQSIDTRARLWGAAFLRVGLLMGAFWIALPSRHREAAYANISWKTLLGLILAVLAVARYPRTVFPILVVVAIIGFFLRPRNPQRGPRAARNRPKQPTRRRPP